MATPALPPTLRTTLNSAVAFGSWLMGTEARASICSGTKMNPMPIPWMRRGHASAQKSMPRLAFDMSKVASPFMSTPKPRSQRWSTRLTSRPTMTSMTAWPIPLGASTSPEVHAS